jgi:hypothetical protein
MKNPLLYVAMVLASASVGILVLLMISYLAWIEGDDGGGVVFPGLGLYVSAPAVLLVLAIVEIIIAFFLFVIVRKIRR